MNGKIEEVMEQLKKVVKALLGFLNSNGDGASKRRIAEVKEALNKAKTYAVSIGASEIEVDEIIKPLEEKLASLTVSATIENDKLLLLGEEVEILTNLHALGNIKPEEENGAGPEEEIKEKWYQKVIAILKNVGQKTIAITLLTITALVVMLKRMTRKTIAFTILAVIVCLVVITIISFFPGKTDMEVDKKTTKVVNEGTTEEIKTEKIEVNVKKVITNAMLAPITVDGRAGEYIEFHYGKNSCFYITGNNKSGSYEPSSKKAHLAFRAPDGKEYRLADFITSYRFPADGQLKLFVRNTEKETMVWSGISENCTAERRSDFQDGPIYVYVKRLRKGEMESDNAEPAKLIVAGGATKEDMVASYKEQNKKTGEAERLIRSVLKNGYIRIFDRPLTVEQPHPLVIPETEGYRETRIDP